MVDEIPDQTVPTSSEGVAAEAVPETVSPSDEPLTAEEVGLNEYFVLAALSYVGVLVLVPYFMEKDNPFVNFHIRQGLLMLGALIISLVVVTWWSVLGSLLFLIIFIADAVAFLQAARGKSWKIPLVGELAERIRI